MNQRRHVRGGDTLAQKEAGLTATNGQTHKTALFDNHTAFTITRLRSVKGGGDAE